MKQQLIKASVFAGAALACAGVFSMYAKPEFLVELANQLWSCF
jgi:hypothetical protein